MAPSPVTWNVLSPGPSERGQMDQIQRMLSPALIHFISLRYCVSLVYFPPPLRQKRRRRTRTPWRLFFCRQSHWRNNRIHLELNFEFRKVSSSSSTSKEIRFLPQSVFPLLCLRNTSRVNGRWMKGRVNRKVN